MSAAPLAPIPTDVTVHRQSRQLELQYDDGRTWRIPFELLRVYSPSAEVQGHGGHGAVLQTGKRDVDVVAVEPVGHYALRLRFSDGHDTGIYAWDVLYRLATQGPALWERYLADLQAQGLDRDAPMTAKSG